MQGIKREYSGLIIRWSQVQILAGPPLVFSELTCLLALRMHDSWKAFTSLALILIVAFAARLAFAWDQERKIPNDALASAPFAQETGNIAYSLATGKGFSNPFRRETGPTAWLTPVYPLLVAATFKLFGIFTVPSFFFLVCLNILFFHSGVHPDFPRGQTRRGPVR